ncbi:hypothetical protein CEUSTIGMA_g4197.t1 [Chlamydomonas eustigma]|uniref:Cwf19-like C-terminal domain-containing protein n=1 Tax=Chlamydomonas eustigma TaxID=1157962 RepID=A0A250X1Y1_9CHLO|nr:hypothetical protein CEUSTIGMA_g4197.t1 [Chlamydomonas eustigma]|eukprot:GAX76750.1 hypothetical protein CEUSTIGMA_g4197.t1 [Chlamydomonas eustigma]
MLGITFKTISSSDFVAKKKKKKKDKEKRKKSKKSSRSHKSSEDSSSDSEGEKKPASGIPISTEGNCDDEGNKSAAVAETAVPLVREEWMTKPKNRSQGGPQDVLDSEAGEKERQDTKKADEEPVIFPGLKIMKKDLEGEGDHKDTVAPLSGLAASQSTKVVGDGGLSWRLKALARAKAQASEAGENLASIVSERWGSLSALTGSLMVGRAAEGDAHVRAARDRLRTGGESGGNKVGSSSVGRPHYLSDVRSDQGQMKRPTGEGSLSWRRDGPRSHHEDRRRDHRDEGGRPSLSGTDEERRDTVQSLNDDKNSEHARRSRDKSSEGHDRPQYSKHADRERNDHPQHSKHGDRERNDRPQSSRHGDRDRNAEVGVISRRRAESGEASFGKSKEQLEALQGLATHLNDFKDDGSFLDRFQKKEESARVKSGHGNGEVQEYDREEVHNEDEKTNPRNRKVEPGAENGTQGNKEDFQVPNPSASGITTSRPLPAVEGVSNKEDFQVPNPSASGITTSRPLPAVEGVSNKSMAEILRARLKGLPVPELPVRTSVPAISTMPVSQAPLSSSEPSGDRAGLSHGKEGGNKRKQHHEGWRGGTGGSRRGKHWDRNGSDSDGGDSSGSSAGERIAGRSRRGRKNKHSGGDDDVVSDVEEDEGRVTLGSEDSDCGGRGREKKEVVNLPLVDAQGRAMKGAFGRESAGGGQRAEMEERRGKPKRVQRYDEDGKKARYFKDDDDVDLQTLVKRTKYGDDGGAEDLDTAVARNISKQARFKATDLDVDAEYDFDGGLEMYESKKRQGTMQQQQKRERDRQVSQFQKATKLEDNCMFCPSSIRRPRHLTVSLAHTSYLMLPAKGRLTPGHCCIVTAEHTPAMRQVDDHVWTEVKNFMKCLIQMFGARGQQCVFFETATNVRSPRPHAVLECVPVGDKELSRAPAYFKKAMLEAESEWSTHHAKAVIDTTTKKGLRESVPVGFPYMYVQFAYGSGMVHVIDDEAKFDKDLARQVMVGLLRLPAEDMHRLGRNPGIPEQERQVAEFKSMWASYDWTRQLQDDE